MTEPALASARAGRGRDAAPLSLIDIRRIDRAAEAVAKAGDLTGQLKKRASIAPSPRKASESAAPAAAAAPAASPPAASPVIDRRTDPAPTAPTEPAPFIARRAVALPEPYVLPEPDLVPSYTVGVATLPALPAPPEIARSAPLPYDDLRSADDLVYYWEELRAGRALPLLSSLDRTRIAISWPDTVMVSYGVDHAAMPQIARLSRLTGIVEFTSMVTEWIISCSRQVARLGKAMETERTFPDTRNGHSCRMLLLPFASGGGASDHVLCHLSCAD
jgi:hypothetical protein